jgi:hypothetical protein
MHRFVRTLENMGILLCESSEYCWNPRNKVGAICCGKETSEHHRVHDTIKNQKSIMHAELFKQ